MGIFEDIRRNTIKSIIAKLSSELSEGRFIHSMGVAGCACKPALL